MEEVWKDIPGIDSGYEHQISNLGNLRCINHKIKSRVGPRKISVDVRGYARSTFKIGGKIKIKKIHRLVASAFLSDYSDKLTVNHIDFNKLNNNVSNLEMLTSRENTLHYQTEKLNKSLSCKRVGVKFHTGIKKWVARTTVNGNRFNLGVFDTEDQAVDVYDRFLKTRDMNMIRVGKGVHNKGRSKYTRQEKLDVIELASRVGVRKASAITGIGTTTISSIRKSIRDGHFDTKK